MRPRAACRSRTIFFQRGLFDLPFDLAGLLVERDEVSGIGRAVVENAEIAEQHGRRAVAPFVHLFAEIAPPKFLALEIVADDAGGAEPRDDALAIRDG